MSREKQIEEMELTPLDILANDIYQHCPDLKDNYCGDTHCVACLANALYNAGYRKQEWISVKERLPETNGACIVCRFDGYVYKTFFSGTFSKTITHWMPLPEAPKMKGGAE